MNVISCAFQNTLLASAIVAILSVAIVSTDCTLFLKNCQLSVLYCNLITSAEEVM